MNIAYLLSFHSCTLSPGFWVVLSGPGSGAGGVLGWQAFSVNAIANRTYKKQFNVGFVWRIVCSVFELRQFVSGKAFCGAFNSIRGEFLAEV
jgi:hypothetical protein